MTPINDIKSDAEAGAMKSMLEEDKCSAGAMRAAGKMYAILYEDMCKIFGRPTAIPTKRDVMIVVQGMAIQIDRETGLPELLAACQYASDDRMDGDLLSFVAEHLLSIARDIERNRPNSANIGLYRDWADKLLKKQVLQAKALEVAEGTTP